ncbi:MAG: hypothetical protein RhofKO_07100 [Rhodothermales bacterium]
MNCHTVLKGDYCHQCGQSASVQRLRFRHLAANALDGLLSLDSKILRTVWHLLIRPGATARAYVEGNRVSYTSPLRYYLLVVASNVALAALLGSDSAATEPEAWADHFVALQISLIFGLFALPIAWTFWLTYGTTRYTIAEHYAFVLYMLGHSVLLLMILTLVGQVVGFAVDGNLEALIPIVLLTLYLIIAGRTFYKESFLQTAWKTGAAYVVVVVTVGLVGAAVAVVSGWLAG